MDAAIFDERVDPGRISSVLLAAAVHVLLFAILIFGVRWQNRPPESVEVELWSAPVAAPAVVEPKPAPEPVVAKPEPVIPKPEIALKEPVKEKPAPKPVARPEPPKPRTDETLRRMRQELAREQTSLALEHEREQMRDQLAREAASANASALATWKERVALHIRSRIREDVAKAVQGNPEAVYSVTILPSYDVLKYSRVKSSGNPAYDDEIERAILKSSPLPRPDKPELFSRELRLTFHPKDR